MALYHLFENEIEDGSEVYSSNYVSKLGNDEFVRRYFDDETQRTQTIKAVEEETSTVAKSGVQQRH